MSYMSTDKFVPSKFSDTTTEKDKLQDKNIEKIKSSLSKILRQLNTKTE